jgi:hypothetical protein
MRNKIRQKGLAFWRYTSGSVAARRGGIARSGIHPAGHGHCGASVVTALFAVSIEEDPDMSKTQTITTKQPEPRPVGKRRVKRPTGDKSAATHPARANSKQATVIGLLRQPKGTTISAIIKAIGWQQHSSAVSFQGLCARSSVSRFHP